MELMSISSTENTKARHDQLQIFYFCPLPFKLNSYLPSKLTSYIPWEGVCWNICVIDKKWGSHIWILCIEYMKIHNTKMARHKFLFHLSHQWLYLSTILYIHAYIYVHIHTYNISTWCLNSMCSLFFTISSSKLN